MSNHIPSLQQEKKGDNMYRKPVPIQKKRYERTAFTHIFPEQMTDYLESLILTGKTRLTFTQNRRHLSLFTDYLGERPLALVGHRDAQGFITWLSEKYPEYSAGYIANIIKSLRRFYKREKEHKRILEDPFLYVKLPRVSRILPRNVPKDREIRTLIAEIPRRNYRDRAVIELLYGSGLRAGELLSLKTDDFNFDEELLTVFDSKSRKERIVPINDITTYSIKEYLEKERPYLHYSTPLQKRKDEKRKSIINIVFLKRGGFPLCTWKLSEIIEDYRKKAGLKDKLTPHSFRHACATEMLKGGASIRHIQVMLGHNDISTTMIYTKLGVDELRTELDKIHPHGAKT